MDPNKRKSRQRRTDVIQLRTSLSRLEESPYHKLNCEAIGLAPTNDPASCDRLIRYQTLPDIPTHDVGRHAPRHVAAAFCPWACYAGGPDDFRHLF